MRPWFRKPDGRGPGPATTDFTADESEFLIVLAEYRVFLGRVPMDTELLELLKGLGYRRTHAAGEHVMYADRPRRCNQVPGAI